MYCSWWIYFCVFHGSISSLPSYLPETGSNTDCLMPLMRTTRVVSWATSFTHGEKHLWNVFFFEFRVDLQLINPQISMYTVARSLWGEMTLVSQPVRHSHWKIYLTGMLLHIRYYASRWTWQWIWQWITIKAMLLLFWLHRFVPLVSILRSWQCPGRQWGRGSRKIGATGSSLGPGTGEEADIHADTTVAKRLYWCH